MTLKKKQDKKHTDIFPHLFPFPTSYQGLPLWPHFQCWVQAVPCFALLPPTWELHDSAPILNSCSSTAAVPASAWSKDHCSSAGKTTFFMFVLQVTHTATLSSKARFWSNNNLDPAVIWFGSPKLQDLPPSCTVWQMLPCLKMWKICTHIYGKWKKKKITHIYHNYHAF